MSALQEREEDEAEDDGCPHCDVVTLFLDYARLGWEAPEIIASLMEGMAFLVASAPEEHRENMTRAIEDGFSEAVDNSVDITMLHNYTGTEH